MKRYAKLQRRIRAEQEDFLNDVIKASGFKVCLEPDRPPEGHSVLVEPEDRSFMNANWTLYPKFAVPNYMSVNKSSPTYKERVAQEIHSVKEKLVEALRAEGLQTHVTAQFTDHVAIHVQV